MEWIFLRKETALCNFFVVIRSLVNNSEFGEDGINNNLKGIIMQCITFGIYCIHVCVVQRHKSA